MSMQHQFQLPFPDAPPQQAQRARRPASLAGTRVAIIDNCRMEHDVYAGMAAALAQEARSRGAVVQALRLPVISWSADELLAQADAVAGSGCAAAIIGLAEAGICQPTVDFAIELEKRGVATVTLVVDPGVALAHAVAAAQMPGLPLIELPLRLHEMTGRAPEVIRELGDRILSGLLADAPAAVDAPVAGSVRLFPAVAEVLHDWAEAAGHPDPGVAALRFLRACEAHGLGDGLPVVPPTATLVQALCEASPLPPEAVIIGAMPPSGSALTVQLAAANAVMAGCEPRHFTCVLAALSAMAVPRYRLRQAAITTHPGTNLIFVSGALAAHAQVASGAGCLGPGQRANLSIGRAVNLCMMNVLRSVPGLTDLGTHGSAAELATCFADRAFGSWPAWHETICAREASTVFVHRCAPLVNVMDQLSKTPEGILSGVAAVSATIGWNNAYCPAELLVVLGPDHAAVIQEHGWSRADVQRFLFDTARNPRASLAGRGFDPSWPPGFADLDRLPVVHRPEDIVVAVAGGCGPQSLVGIPWGLSRAALAEVDAHDGLQVRAFSDSAA